MPRIKWSNVPHQPFAREKSMLIAKNLDDAEDPIDIFRALFGIENMEAMWATTNKCRESKNIAILDRNKHK